MVVPIYVWGMSPKTTLESITEYFQYCGTIKTITENYRKKDTVITKIIQIDFESEDAVQLARLLHGTSLEGVEISISDSEVCSVF